MTLRVDRFESTVPVTCPLFPQSLPFCMPQKSALSISATPGTTMAVHQLLQPDHRKRSRFSVFSAPSSSQACRAPTVANRRTRRREMPGPRDPVR